MEDYIDRQNTIDTILAKLTRHGKKQDIVEICEYSVQDREGWYGAILGCISVIEDMKTAKPKEEPDE